jgi:phenylacetate-CoA ligase
MVALSYKNKTLLKLYSNLPTFLRELFAFIYSKKVQRRRFGGVFSAQLEELKRNESLSLEERKAKQFDRLKEILIYAGMHTPYYQELFAAIGFDPEEVHSVDDLRRIPVLTKDIILDKQEELLAENFAGPTITNHTSGTTGTALKFVLSEEAHQRHYACLWFHYRWAGFQRGDRLATFAGHPVAAAEGARPSYWLFDRNENELMFSPYHISPDTIPSYVQALSDFKPVIIRGYPNIIYLIAHYLLDNTDIEISPKGIFTYGETTFDHQRQTIDKAFGCPVYSSYGNGEHAGHLLQCLEGNFHEITNTAVIEVLNPDGEPARPGETGELVVTSLINKAMPMIRYRVGDMGIKTTGACKCGRTSPIFKEITGRTVDYIITPDGRHLRSFASLFFSTYNIKEAQAIQEEIDQITIKIVTRPGYSERDEKTFLDSVHKFLGDEIHIQLEIVDEIPRTAQGKYRLVISKVPIQI